MNRDPAPSSAGCTAARLFELIWDTMADVLGSAATATLVRRSVARAATRRPDLTQLVVSRTSFHYSYQIPDAWREHHPDPVASLRELARELTPLLVELTGPVITRRLDALADLRRSGVSFQEHD